MGLLDDAIREHLELKRRHGADAAEIARLEQEALGPARRTSGEDLAPATETAPTPTSAPPEPAVGEAHVPVVDDDYVFEGHEEFEEAEPVAEEPATEVAPAAEIPPAAEVAPAAEVPPGAGTAPQPPPPPPEEEPQATIEFEPGSEDDWADDWDESRADAPPPAAEADEPEDESHSEDVLEETPDFLQETPEHDRLWFEQKPPRDFEF